MREHECKGCPQYNLLKADQNRSSTWRDMCLVDCKEAAIGKPGCIKNKKATDSKSVEENK